MKSLTRYFKNMMVIVFVSLMSIQTASAIDLKTAKSQGMIGEQADGYLGLVTENVPAEVKELVKTTNEKRKQKYESIAQKEKITVAKVAQAIAIKFQQETESGNYIQQDGKWIKK